MISRNITIISFYMYNFKKEYDFCHQYVIFTFLDYILLKDFCQFFLPEKLCYEKILHSAGLLDSLCLMNFQISS